VADQSERNADNDKGNIQRDADAKGQTEIGWRVAMTMMVSMAVVMVMIVRMGV
jgi:hypothetical protein